MLKIIAAASVILVSLVIVVWRSLIKIILLEILIKSGLTYSRPHLSMLMHWLLHFFVISWIMHIRWLHWHIHSSDHPWLRRLCKSSVSRFFFFFEFDEEFFEIFYFVINMLLPFIMLLAPKR